LKHFAVFSVALNPILFRYCHS